MRHVPMIPAAVAPEFSHKAEREPMRLAEGRIAISKAPSWRLSNTLDAFFCVEASRRRRKPSADMALGELQQ